MSGFISGKIDLTGQVAIVTGAAGGIGKAAACALAREGATIVAGDILSVEETLAKINQSSGQAVGVRCDVTRQEDVQQMVQWTAREFGKINILVTSAGVCKSTLTADISSTEWDLVQNINLKGTFFCCQAVFPIMKERRYGKIVAIGSSAGKTGSILAGPHYAASKGGVHAMMKSFAKEGAPYNVYVNAVAPGPVRTEMTEGWPYNPETIPLQRLGEPEDIAEAVVFLSSQASHWITGITLDVTGGMVMA